MGRGSETQLQVGCKFKLYNVALQRLNTYHIVLLPCLQSRLSEAKKYVEERNDGSANVSDI